MADNQIYEMISAFAIGCMDEENFIHFLDYIQSGGELPEGELGEMQNVMALLPLMIEQIQPDPKLKSKVAKKLLSLKNEIKKNKRKTKLRKTLVQETRLQETNFQNTEIKPEKNINPNLISKNVKEKDSINNSKEINQSANETAKNLPSERKILKPLDLPIQQIKEEKTKSTKTNNIDKRNTSKKVSNLPEPIIKEKIIEKNSGLYKYLSILFFFLFLAVGYLLNTQNTKINNLETEIIKKQNSLENRTGLLEKFVLEHQKLIDFFSRGNIRLVNMGGTKVNPKGSGKLLFSLEKSEALLYVNNMPALEENEIYVVWLVSRGRSYPLKSFRPNETEKYIHIEELPYIIEENINMFRLTKEKDNIPDIPEGKTFLYGIFKK